MSPFSRHAYMPSSDKNQWSFASRLVPSPPQHPHMKGVVAACRRRAWPRWADDGALTMALPDVPGFNERISVKCGNSVAWAIVGPLRFLQQHRETIRIGILKGETLHLQIAQPTCDFFLVVLPGIVGM